MNRCCASLILALALAVPLTAGAATNNLNRTVSVTGQFTAYAPGNTLPSALCVFAEQVKRAWLARLDLPDRWRDPVVLVVREQPGTSSVPIRLAATQVGPVVKYEITLYAPPPIQDTELAAAIINALCLEAANRPRSAKTLVGSMPLWLVTGLTASVQGNTDWLVVLARRTANSARPPDASGLLQATNLPEPGPERDLFRANAWLLTDSLLRMPGGPGKLQRFLLELGVNPDAAFQIVYGSEFPDAVALEKWWSLQQARLGSVVVPQNWTVQETSQRLEKVLEIRPGLRLQNAGAFAEEAWVKKALPGVIRELQILLLKAHPLYRSVLQDYVEMAELLRQEKMYRYRQQVTKTARHRAEVDRQVAAIAAELDRIELTYRDRDGSNPLDGYFRIFEQVEQFEKFRRNPISDHLDKFE